MFEVLFGHWPVCNEIIYHISISAVLSQYYLFAAIFSSKIISILFVPELLLLISYLSACSNCLNHEITMVPSLSLLLIARHKKCLFLANYFPTTLM